RWPWTSAPSTRRTDAGRARRGPARARPSAAWMPPTSLHGRTCGVSRMGRASPRLSPCMERALKSICVYCGSNAGSRPAYAERAMALGDRIAKEGLALVYGGGNVGLMGVVADAVLAAGGEVVGVIPQQLVDWE